MDNNLDDQFLVVQANFDENKQTSYEKMNKYDSKLYKQYSKLDKLTEMIKSMIDQNQNSKSSSYEMDSPNSQDPSTEVPDNKKSPPL